MQDPKHRNDRAVDRHRNAAGEARIEGDVGSILTSFVLRDERLYFICERGVASAQMADQIDPDRTNPGLPKVIQRPEIHYGATTPFMQRTLCVGAELFDQTYLPGHVQKDHALGLALDTAVILADIQDNINALIQSANEVWHRLQGGEIRAHAIPKTNSLNHRIEGSINALRKAALSAQELADLFYPRRPNAKFTAHLRGALASQIAPGDFEWPFLEWAFDVLSTLSNYRNAMIHPDTAKQLVVRDYELNADGNFITPTVQIVHPVTPQRRIDAVLFLRERLSDISIVFEGYTVIFCGRNARKVIDGLRSFVARDEGDQRTGTQYHWASAWLEGHPKYPQS